MPLGFLRKHFGRKRSGRMKVTEEESSLEERVSESDVSTDYASSSCSQDVYDHTKVVAQLIKASYCTRRLNKAVQSTSSREELNALGYEISDENPMLATDIFIYTRDDVGKQAMKTKLFNSTDTREQAYAYFFACEEGLETLREYGEILRVNMSSPYIAFNVGEKTGDVDLATKALKEIKRINPEEAERLAPRYRKLRKTPVPSYTLKTYKPALS